MLNKSTGTTSPLAQPAQKIFWGQSFDFRRAIVFCLRRRLSKHKMTR